MGLKQFGVALALATAVMLAVPATVEATGARAVRRQAESAMRVTGTLQIDAQGHVSGHTLDQADKLPEGVRTLVAESVPEWQFTPRTVDGRPEAGSTDMSLLIRARPAGDDAFDVEIASVAFGLKQADPEANVRVAQAMTAPEYPRDLAALGASGTVYLLLRVGRDGKVADAAVEQVNLRFVDDERQMEKMRRAFAQAALRAPAGWTFLPPTRGKLAQQAYWTVRVPVAFRLDRSRPEYGRWDSYIRGPRAPAPWDGDELAKVAGFAPDALPEGQLYQPAADTGVRLLSMQGGQP